MIMIYGMIYQEERRQERRQEALFDAPLLNDEGKC